MVVINSNEVIVDVNKKASEVLGYPSEELIGKNWLEKLVPAASRENAQQIFHNMLTGKLDHVHSEFTLLTSTGQEITFDFHNLLARDTSGNILGVLSSAENVTERKRKQETSKKTEDRLQISLNHMLEGVQIIDYDWRYIYINKAAATQGRKKEEELLGCTMMQAYPGIEKTKLFNILRSCMINRIAQNFDNEFEYADKSKSWFELSIEPVPEGLLILSLDITKNKTAQTELSNYRQRLEAVIAQRTAEFSRTNQELTTLTQELKKTKDALNIRSTILNNAKEAIVLTNTKGDFLFANQGATTIYGYNLDEFLNMNINKLLQPEDSASVTSLLNRISTAGGASLEMVHKRKNNTPITVKMDSSTVETVHGKSIILVIRRINYRD